MANLIFFVFLTILGFTLGNSVIKVENEKLSNRIVGGSVAQEGQFPYQVALLGMFTGYFCSGSILNEKWILTAARCVKGRGPTFFIVAGVTDLSNLIPPTSIYQIAKIIVHESSNPALIKTKRSITFSENVNKIDLPPANMNAVDTPVVVSGWGTFYPGAKPSKKLLYLQSKIYDQESCSKRMAQIGYPPITESHICTFSHSGQGLCDGDSGDPVVSGDYQVGIVLYGNPCALGDPDVSVNVWHYVDWIKSYIVEQ